LTGIRYEAGGENMISGKRKGKRRKENIFEKTLDKAILMVYNSLVASFCKGRLR